MCEYCTVDVASGMLGSQEQNMKDSQKEIMDDISTVRENIEGVWGRIGELGKQREKVYDDPLLLQITGHRSCWVS